jgi:hypothetical protein
MCARSRASTSRSTTSRRSGSRRHRHHQRQYGAPGKNAIEGERQAALGRIARRRPSMAWPTAFRRRDGDRGRRQAQDLPPVPVLKRRHIGTNTSSISITRLAASTDRPERFIGVHFMTVPVMELVEVIRGIATDDATY